MMLYGKAPYLECSTKGDRRFSAFVAKVNGRSIEEQYQAAKIFEGGVTGLHWTKAKGKKAQNAEECAALYERLWKQYIAEHPELHEVLISASGFCDMFAGKGLGVNQACVLWEIRSGLIAEQSTAMGMHNGDGGEDGIISEGSGGGLRA